MKCRENRRRRKQNRRRIRRTRLDAWLERNRQHIYETSDLRGNARPYYEPFDIRWSGNRPSTTRVSYRIRPTQAYHDVIEELIAKCGDMTIDVTPILNRQSGPVEVRRSGESAT